MTRRLEPRLAAFLLAVTLTTTGAWASVAGSPPANRPPTKHYTRIPGHLSAAEWRRAYIAKYHHPPTAMRTIK